jgi:hypothetical protein
VVLCNLGSINVAPYDIILKVVVGDLLSNAKS